MNSWKVVFFKVVNCQHGANNTANTYWASDNFSSEAWDFNTDWVVPDSIFWDTKHWKWKQLLFCTRQNMHTSWHFGRHSGATEKHLVYCWRCGWEHLLCLRSSEYWQLWCPVSFQDLCRLAVCPSRQRFHSASCSRSEPAYWILEIIWKRWTHQHQCRIKYCDRQLPSKIPGISPQGRSKDKQPFWHQKCCPSLFAVIRKAFHSFCSSLIQNTTLCKSSNSRTFIIKKLLKWLFNLDKVLITTQMRQMEMIKFNSTCHLVLSLFSEFELLILMHM